MSVLKIGLKVALKVVLKKMIVGALMVSGIFMFSCQTNTLKSDSSAQKNKSASTIQSIDSPKTTNIKQGEGDNADIKQNQRAQTPLDGLSLQELLLAQMAYQQRNYNGALALYYLLATRVQDPAIAKKAALIAAFLDEEAVLESMLKIWLEVYPNNQEALMLGLSNSLVLANLDVFEVRFKKIMQQKQDLDFLQLTQKLPLNIEAYEPLQVLLVELQNQYAQPQMYTVLAFVYEHQGKFEKSVQAAQKAIVKFDNPMVRLLLINNYKVLGLQTQSDQLLEESFEKYSSNRLLTEARIKLAWINQNFVLAYQLTRQMYERNPSDPNLAYQFARLALKQKDFKQAKQVFTSLLVYPSLQDEMNYSLGLIENELAQFETALRFFSKVQPSSFYKNSQYFRANIIWQATKDTEAVIAVFDQLALNSEEDKKLSVAVLEADFWTTVVQFQTALDRLQPFVKSNLDNFDVLYQYALLLDSAGNTKESLSTLKTLLQKFPENSSILNAYGYVLGNRTDQVDLALTYVEKSLALEPNNPAALDSKGWLLYKLNKYKQALPFLQEAFEKYPHDEVAAHLGATLWRLGLLDQADEIWQQGFKLQPESSIIQEIKQKLMGLMDQ
ncbi:MAG: tetratricopeptide repeat protein [Saccharospirillaceae bacterium]|nr:tetratricopeptide repeat protein [Pseudomonadales bacterium]NRB78127.1 tetratricopeptide repeat protein [Saccharospirillaceae bacterium]